jgi:hypothetical protein
LNGLRKAFFSEEKNQKTFAYTAERVGDGPGEAARPFHSPCPGLTRASTRRGLADRSTSAERRVTLTKQKFFASFFQKRSASLA